MLSKEDNEFLTRCGPQSAMGAYLRRFWIPAMALSEVPLPDEPPVRLRLLSEDLIVFRDTLGRIGAMEERCPHRLASLYFGRNEECGIRCIYHGWKFDVEGRCLETPNEPESSRFAEKVRANAYLTAQSGGLLWIYLGERASAPALPGFEWLDLPDEQRYISRWEQECNSIQAMEGELDSAHVSFLHRRVDGIAENKMALTGSYFRDDTAPSWHVTDTEYGFIAASARAVENDNAYWRMNQFLLPFYTMITALPGGPRMTRMWVPKDEEHCWVIAVSFRPDRPLEAEELRAWRAGENTHRLVHPGTTQPVETRANDYLIDRCVQKTQTFTGIAGIRAQDAMATESAGPIADRTKEHLGTSDRAIIAMRKRLIREARALEKDGTTPKAAEGGDLYRVRASSAVLPKSQEFTESEEVLEDLKA
ncbi:MAG: Rieske 2Fe-2S domain-containing protein [Burkholderiaceae bacterium]|jgi:phenylpropionate dioxygenase-like ring-hydroxylating dioxygenase large terminal subunit